MSTNPSRSSTSGDTWADYVEVAQADVLPDNSTTQSTEGDSAYMKLPSSPSGTVTYTRQELHEAQVRADIRRILRR